MVYNTVNVEDETYDQLRELKRQFKRSGLIEGRSSLSETIKILIEGYNEKKNIKAKNKR